MAITCEHHWRLVPHFHLPASLCTDAEIHADGSVDQPAGDDDDDDVDDAWGLNPREPITINDDECDDDDQETADVGNSNPADTARKAGMADEGIGPSQPIPPASAPQGATVSHCSHLR